MKKKSKKKYIPSKNERENIRVKIEDLNEKGEGIAFHNKIKLNVKKALPGEDVLVRYMPDRPRKDRIRLVEILSPSTLRVQPPCQYFEKCGGCQLQHVRYKKQLEFKQNWLKQLLLSYPQLKQTAVDQVVGMPQPANYRNKTQMPFQKQSEKIIYGLYQKGTHEITPIDYCLVENKDANRVLQIIREWAEHYRIEPYDETSNTGILRHALIRKGQFTNQIMVVVVAKEIDSAYWQYLIQDLKMGIPTLKSVILNINSDQTNNILGNENLVVWGDPFIEEQLGRIRFRIYPNTFFQTNSVQAVRMLEKMSGIVNFQKTDQVLDLFCGVGAIGLYVAGEVDKVVGIDINADSIAAATQNADDNEIWNARFIGAEIEHKIGEFLPADFKPNIIFVDPPRKGLTPRLISEISAMNPEKIIYISCNPKTLVEDLAAFNQLNYRTDKIYPFDMFPHTSQLENLVLLQKST